MSAFSTPLSTFARSPSPALSCAERAGRRGYRRLRGRERMEFTAWAGRLCQWCDRIRIVAGRFQRHVVAQPGEPIDQSADHFRLVLPIKMIRAQFPVILTTPEQDIRSDQNLVSHCEDRFVVAEVGSQPPIQRR